MPSRDWDAHSDTDSDESTVSSGVRPYLDGSFPYPDLVDTPLPRTSDDGSSIGLDDSEVDEPRSRSTRTQIPERVGNFRLLAKHRLAGTEINVAKWKSDESGLSVVWADTPDLISTFATTVVTEIFSSGGMPHTLEHLTFMGSQHYPWPNVLDKIAGRLMTQATNARTEDNNTTYTVASASEEGLLELIPVYLDHVLFPLLAESSFKTEIYHIDGEGEEGGTVFSEMQGEEGSKTQMMTIAEDEAVYSLNNAYRYDPGGMLPHLRKLRLQEIIDYHASAYVPQNMTIVVTGCQMNPRRLLSTISRTTERDIRQAGLARGSHPQGWIRPFVESRTARYDPIIEKDKTIMIPYADTNTSTGEIWLTFVGPPLREASKITALGVLGDYLSGSSHSILNRKFVEVPEPACAAISLGITFHDPTILELTLSAVKKDRLLTLADDLRIVLKQLCRRHLDMSAVQLVIKQQIIGLERRLETNPASYIRSSLLPDIVHGDEHGNSFREAFSDLKILHALKRWSSDDWLDLLRESLLERHAVTLVGTPSLKLVHGHDQDEAARLAKTKRKFGPEGLAKLAQELKNAEIANDNPAPESILKSYAVPDFQKISWHTFDTARSNGIGRGRELYQGHAQRVINADGPDLPFLVQFDDVPSSFVSVSVFLPCSASPILSLYVDTFFTMPIEINGATQGSAFVTGRSAASDRLLRWQEVSRQLDADLTSRNCSVMHEGIYVSLKAARSVYHKAISWLSALLYGTVFDGERLKYLVNTKLQVLPEIAQDGNGIASCAVQSICCSSKSVLTSTNALFETEYYPKLKDRLDKDPTSVIQELKHFRKVLLSTNLLRFSVVGEISKLENPSSTWLDHFPDSYNPSKSVRELGGLLRPRLSAVGLAPAKRAIVYRIVSSESTYVNVGAKRPDWNHVDFYPVEVACAVLSQTNGPLWNATRTSGLCYSVWIENEVEAGFLSLAIYRTPDAITALAAIRQLLTDIGSKKIRISPLDVEAAQSAIAYGVVESESTAWEAASNNFEDTVILNRPRRFSHRYLAQIERVTAVDVYRAIVTWIVPLVQSRTSVVGVSTSPAKMSSLVGGLQQLGYEVEQRDL